MRRLFKRAVFLNAPSFGASRAGPIRSCPAALRRALSAAWTKGTTGDAGQMAGLNWQHAGDLIAAQRHVYGMARILPACAVLLACATLAACQQPAPTPNLAVTLTTSPSSSTIAVTNPNHNAVLLRQIVLNASPQDKPCSFPLNATLAPGGTRAVQASGCGTITSVELISATGTQRHDFSPKTGLISYQFKDGAGQIANLSDHALQMDHVIFNQSPDKKACNRTINRLVEPGDYVALDGFGRCGAITHYQLSAAYDGHRASFEADYRAD
jgi:hypothetical protein